MCSLNKSNCINRDAIDIFFKENKNIDSKSKVNVNKTANELNV